jgi:hypothetical protein
MGLFTFLKKPYLVNYNSLEIHKVNNIKGNCQVQAMTNTGKVYTRKANRLLQEGYNGCRWCYPDADTDKK